MRKLVGKPIVVIGREKTVVMKNMPPFVTNGRRLDAFPFPIPFLLLRKLLLLVIVLLRGGFSIPGGIELEDGEILQEPDQEVYDICGSTNNAAVTDITCEEACAKAACCYWTGEDSCYNDFSVTCDVWREAGCFVFSVQHEQEVP